MGHDKAASLRHDTGMGEWFTGFALFRDTLPEPVVRLLDPGGAVPEGAVRQAVAVAVASLALAFWVRLGLAACERLWWWLRGLAAVELASPRGTSMRRLAGMVAVGSPWLALVQLHWAGTLWRGWPVAAGLAWAAWVLLRAADHHRLAFDRRSDAVLDRRGWAAGPWLEQRWHLTEVFICEDGQALPTAAHRPKGLRVRPNAALWPVWIARLGSEPQARAWLGRLASDVGAVAVLPPLEGIAFSKH
jgi:hypothetical protein